MTRTLAAWLTGRLIRILPVPGFLNGLLHPAEQVRKARLVPGGNHTEARLKLPCLPGQLFSPVNFQFEILPPAAEDPVSQAQQQTQECCILPALLVHPVSDRFFAGDIPPRP